MSLKLDKLNIKYNEDGDWQGTVGVDRRFVPNGQIKNLQLSLTPEQWCSLCMQEDGENYVGGCCGSMRAVQDRLNSTFREGGWIGAADFRRMAELCTGHDGFENWEDETILAAALDEGLPSEVKETWNRLGVIWQAAKDHLIVEESELPKKYDVTMAAFHRFFHRDDDGGQSACNNMTEHAALLAALRTIYDTLEGRKQEALTGFGLRAQDGTLGVNRLGSCLYTSREEAARMLKVWSEHKDFEPGVWSIVHFQITVENGLQWIP